jgi:hypothetical protein
VEKEVLQTADSWKQITFVVINCGKLERVYVHKRGFGNPVVVVRPIIMKCHCKEYVFLIRIVGSGVQTGSTWHVGHFWPIVPGPGDCENGEFCRIELRRGDKVLGENLPPSVAQIPLDQTRARTRAAAVGSQRLLQLWRGLRIWVNPFRL